MLNVCQSSPLVSVLMPVRNAAVFLPEALQSVLSQTYTNLEILIIDDGSTDRGMQRIAAVEDPRIRILGDERQRGITARLNQGLEAATGKYIARMDADDLCAPERLERQVRRMETDPLIDVLGTAAAYIDEQGEVVGAPRPAPNDDRCIKWRMLTSNCIIHPSVMLRGSVVKEYRYSEDCAYAQDYDLWLRLAVKGFRFANLPEVLLLQRRHSTTVSVLRRKEQIECAADALVGYFKEKCSVELEFSAALGIINPPADVSGEASGPSPVAIIKDLVSKTVKFHSSPEDKKFIDFIRRDLYFFALRYFYRSLKKGFSLSASGDISGALRAIIVAASGRAQTISIFRENFFHRRQYVKEARNILKGYSREKMIVNRG